VSGFPSSAKVDVYYIRTSFDEAKYPGSYWQPVYQESAGITSNPLQITWAPPDILSYPNQVSPSVIDPYSRSEFQEYFVAANILENGNLICTGNPNPGPTLATAYCPTCRVTIVTKPNISNAVDLNRFMNIKSGYSFTYTGKRFDHPKDDSGIEVSGDFSSRMEYEAPIKLCSPPNDYTLIPQLFTKSNRWGYWNPAKPEISQRINMWNDGSSDLRFLITSPDYSYPWNNQAQGAIGHKIYRRPDNLGTTPLSFSVLNDTFMRSMYHTSLDNENLYYPPYMLTIDTIAPEGVTSFVRNDSIYSIWGTPTQPEGAFCQPSTKNSAHGWHVKYKIVTDAEILSSFGSIKHYFPSNPIVLISFFESVNIPKMSFREDWYLMQDVGLVGIDQAFYDENDLALSSLYFNTDYMKLNATVSPALSMRAERAYLGESLEITTYPTNIKPGGTYMLTAIGANSRLPYDGPLEVDAGTGPTLWLDSNQKPNIVDNGKIFVYLPENFPMTTITAKFRPKIATTPSQYETQMPYNSMPWSNQISETTSETGTSCSLVNSALVCDLLPGNPTENYFFWQNHYQQSVFGPLNGDFDNNGQVDGLDYALWRKE
jgi:hypothetical protein